MRIRGRRVLVTGASRGLGEQLARYCAEAGARVALVARSPDTLGKLAADLGGQAYPADLGNPEELAGLIDRVEADGSIDVLVNNAGIDMTGSIAGHHPSDIRQVLDVNLAAPIELCRQAVPAMAARGSGWVVNVSSVAGSITGPGMSLYGASKAGLNQFNATLRAELRGTGIGLTLVEVGPVATEMMDSLRSYPPTRRSIERLERLGLVVDLQPETVARATVRSVEHERRHLRLPRRQAAMPMLAEAPRRIVELLLTGVDNRVQY